MTTISANLEITLHFRCLTTALILQKIAGSIKCARETRQDFHDGRHWVRYPIEPLVAAFPWVAERTIRGKVSNLIDAGILLSSAHYNETPQDRTRWYALRLEDQMLSQLFSS